MHLLSLGDRLAKRIRHDLPDRALASPPSNSHYMQPACWGQSPFIIKTPLPRWGLQSWAFTTRS